MEPFKLYQFNNLSLNHSFDALNKFYEENLIAFEQVGCINWNKFNYCPQVFFKIMVLSDGLYIQFQIAENHVIAKYTTDNSPVYKDSCVELFIDPTNDGSYYNFEFNCIGAMLLGHGAGRKNRENPPVAIYNSIIRNSSLKKAPTEPNNTNWELQVKIPFNAFFKHSITSLKGKTIRFNVYKCGDETPVPHYLTWQPIETKRPDFHRPEYFKNVIVQ